MEKGHLFRSSGKASISKSNSSEHSFEVVSKFHLNSLIIWNFILNISAKFSICFYNKYGEGFVSDFNTTLLARS